MGFLEADPLGASGFSGEVGEGSEEFIGSCFAWLPSRMLKKSASGVLVAQAKGEKRFAPQLP